MFDLNIIIHSPYTSNNRYESVPQKWTDRTYSTHDLKEIWEECISTLFYVSVFPINIDLRTVFVVKKGKKPTRNGDQWTVLYAFLSKQIVLFGRNEVLWNKITLRIFIVRFSNRVKKGCVVSNIIQTVPDTGTVDTDQQRLASR